MAHVLVKNFSATLFAQVVNTVTTFVLVPLISVFGGRPVWRLARAHRRSRHIRYNRVYREARRQGVPYILRPHGSYDPVIRERKVAAKWVLERLFQEQVTYTAAGIHYTSEDEQRLSNCPTASGFQIKTTRLAAE